MYPLYNKLTTCDKGDREKLLNIEIAKALLKMKTDEPRKEDIENFIKTITYDKNANDVKVLKEPKPMEGVSLLIYLISKNGIENIYLQPIRLFQVKTMMKRNCMTPLFLRMR